MIRKLKIDHLRTVKSYPSDVQVNFSSSNMEMLLTNEELPFSREAILLHGFPGDERIGSRHLLETLSRKEMVPPENIFLSLGTSLANFILWSVLFKRGDEVLIEFPAYEPMFKVPAYLGAKIRFFKRDPIDFSLSVEAIASVVSEKTRMIILTDPHNPSGNQISREVLQYLKKLQLDRGITIFIDEVYGRFYRDKSLFIDYPEFVVTGSLSKYYGLGSLRVGWAFAPAAIVEKALDFNDYLTPEIPFPPLYLAHLLLEHPVLGQLDQRIRKRIRANREIVSSYFDRTDFLSCYIPKNGLLFFPEVNGAVDVRKFHDLLYKKYRMVVTEGRFFQMPRHFRIAAVCDPVTLAGGLQRLDAALGESLTEKNNRSGSGISNPAKQEE